MAVEELLKDENIAILQARFGKQADLLKVIDEWKCVMVDGAIGVVMKNPSLGEKKAFFGYVDFKNDIKIVEKLFLALEENAKEMGAEQLIGPLNYATWMNYRWMTYGFEYPKVTPEISNSEYMPDMIGKLGYQKCFTYSSELVKAKDENFDVFKNRYKELVKEGFSFTQYIGLEITPFLDNIFSLVNSFSKNPLYCDIPYEIFKETYKFISENLNPVLHLCKKDENICGYSISYKNVEFEDWWIFKNIAVKDEFRNLGIGSALRYLIHESAIENECLGVVHHFRYDENFSMKFSKNGEIIKRYALFQKKLVN